jgi:uncharacterized damage-inducible protein DinB
MLEESLKMFREARARTLALTDGLSQAQLDYAPAPGRWSVGEVLDHLLLAEKMNREQFAELIALQKSRRRAELRRSFADVNVSVAYLPKSLLPLLDVPFTVLNMFIPAGVREAMMRNRTIPAQNPDAATPRRGRPAGELRHEPVASLDETQMLFAANPGLDYRTMVVQHPLMGRNDVGGLLRFLALHEGRHQAQMTEVMSAPHFPRG